MTTSDVHDADRAHVELRRRGFLGAGIVMFGAAGLASIAHAQSNPPLFTSPASQPAFPPPSDAADPADLIDPPVPPNFKKGAQVDARFPISYRRSVPAACRVMTAHFDAISQRSYAALARTMHFPFASVERLDTVVVNSPAELTNSKAPMSLNFSPDGEFNTDHFSRLKPGAYDMLISLEVINFDPCHVNMAMTFDRYNKEGFRILRCEGVYCVTNNDGRWGIQLMSTIWTPADLIGHVYEDAIQAAIRLRANHLVSYIDDDDAIDRPRPSRGPTASISGGGIGNLFDSQLGDDPIAQFKIKGVKSRLSVRGEGSVGAPGRAARAGAPNAAPAAPAPGGEGQQSRALALDPRERRAERPGPHVPKWQGILDPYNALGVHFYEGTIGADTRIIHHTADKVHRYSGAARYTTAGEQISVSMEVGVVVLGTNTDWVQHGTLRYVTTHDRNNDVRM